MQTRQFQLAATKVALIFSFAGVALTSMTVLPESALAYHKTNKPEVRSSLEKDGWVVVYSKEFNHDEYMKLAASVASQTTTAWMADFATESLRQIITGAVRKSPQIGEQLRNNLKVDDLIPAIRSSFNGKQVELSPARGVSLQVGRATYNRAECTNVPAPTFKNPRRTVEKCVSTPNTYQPYVRFRV